MKKLILGIILLVTASVSGIWSQQYYESNILGMKIGKPSSVPVENSDYILKVESLKDKEIRSLLKGGEVYSILTITRNAGTITETVVTDENVTITTRKNGYILTEERKIEGESSRLYEYGYRDGRLESVEYSEDGRLFYTDNYKYTMDNRLLDVVRTYHEDDSEIISSFIFKNGRIRNYWSESESGQNFIKFDRTGIFFSEMISAEGWSETREYLTDELGRRIEVVTDGKGAKFRLIYSKEGSLLSSVSYAPEGGQIEELIYKWEGELLKELVRKSELSTEKISYIYDDSGKLKEEIHLKNGNIIMKITLNSDDDYIETLYRQGSPVIEIHYKDGVRVSTERIRDKND